jgi:Rne/Rng family ribonuclease
MKEILDQLEIPDGMAVILRTAGMEQAPPDIQRDLDYLLRLWDNIREQTLQSSAPSLIYEEANLIKRSVRDLYSQDIQEILIAGEEGYSRASDFMRAIMRIRRRRLNSITIRSRFSSAIKLKTRLIRYTARSRSCAPAAISSSTRRKLLSRST